MNAKTRVATALLIVLFLTALWMAGTPAGAQSPTPTSGQSISGLVRAPSGPVAGATVRVPSSNRSATTRPDGSFLLIDLTPGQAVNVSAWAPGYFVAGKNDVLPGATDVLLELAPHPTEDVPSYQWISAPRDPNQPLSCQHCMGCSSCNTAQSKLPFDEWQRDAHSQSAINPRFLSMYNGTDLRGNQGPPTRYATHRDYGQFPLPPDLTAPYYGAGFKLDFPESAGNCAACHAPATAVNAPYHTDPNQVTGVGKEGVACDLCHKVWDVRLEPATGLPYANMPGVLSFEFKRPGEGQQIFIGPYDDVPGRSVYSPLQNRSEFCAPCHYGVFWNVPIYNSFGEWLASPYADPQTGKTCQDCHMPHVGATHFSEPPPDSPRLAYERDPRTIFSHAMPGASDVALLQNAVTMQVTAQREEAALSVDVVIVNDKTGHSVPTDSPLRNMLLIVSASDEQGRSLSLKEGDTLPDWAGDYAGRPGRGYAKILQELWTETTPSGAYWQQTRIVGDNRIAAFAEDASRYVFERPGTGPAKVQVKLVFRRAFYALMQQKGWTDPDIVMQSFSSVVQ